MLARKPSVIALKAEDREELEEQQKQKRGQHSAVGSEEHLASPQTDDRKKRTAAQRIGIAQ